MSTSSPLQDENESPDDWSKIVETALRDAFKLKNAMMKKGLKKAKAICPECNGMLYGQIMGSRNHIHFHCTGSCGRRLME